MNRPSKTLATALLWGAVVTSGPVQAADEEARFAVDGIGQRDCTDFLTAVEGQEREAVSAYASWTNGFVTSANISTGDTFDLTPWQTVEVMLAKMRAYCTANPDTGYVIGVGLLLQTLIDDRLTTASEVVQARVGDRAVPIYAEVLDRVRAALVDRGADLPTPPDGAPRFDDTFAEALRAYQTEVGIQATGLPDQPTLVNLLDRRS